MKASACKNSDQRTVVGRCDRVDSAQVVQADEDTVSDRDTGERVAGATAFTRWPREAASATKDESSRVFVGVAKRRGAAL